MAFQFYCPQGHLLEGHETQAGQHCQCPYCQSVFIVPSPHPTPTAQQAPEDAFASQAEDVATMFPNVAGRIEEGEVALDVQGQKEDPDRIIHILCPEGHELPTPVSMVNTDAMCPHCGTLFRLRYQDSKEAKEERQRERERREQRFGKKALNMAIVAAVLVVLGILGMIFILSSG